MLGIMLLSGCQRADYAENQAYVVMLGIDQDAESNLVLTVKYPKLSGGTGGASAGNTEESSAYMVTQTSGSGFQEALNRLHVSVPREVNLSALSMIVVSAELADNGRLEEVVEQISENYRMYSSAYIAICKGNAGEFIKAQEPQIGSRLSQGLKALIENAERLGSIPDSKFADVLYGANSVYSDQIVMACSLEKDINDKEMNVYSGSYIIKNGTTALQLNEHQTMMVNVLMGDVRQFSYVNGQKSAFISVDKKPDITVSVDGGVEIKVDISMSAMITTEDGKVYDFAEMIKADICEIIDMCHAVRAEPFGFAERAAGKSITLENWLEYNWRNAFADSSYEVNISMNELF